MPKLNFTPKTHYIGENTDIFITSCKKGDPPICMKCNDVAAFIIGQMYPEHKPRTEIVPLVMEKFSCSEEESIEAVQTVISTLLPPKEETENE